ncbi:unnamed protein product [Urochloa humidicola]
MASGVFGVPISESSVILSEEYKEPITQKDIADYTMKMINDGGKDSEAQLYVDYLKKRNGPGISAKCLIYNATGTTLNLDTYKDWHGHIYDTPYPAVIQNGQWGAFLHVNTTLVAGSAGAVVYRSDIPSSTSKCDWLFSWSIPYNGDNRVFTEIREEGHFSNHWDYIYHEKLEKSGRSSSDSLYGYVSNTEIGEGTTSNVRGIFQLPY